MDALKVKRWAISAIARAYEPGCKADTALVLLSPDQGIGKTTFFTELAMDYYVNFPATSSDKDSTLLLQSGWLVDIGEIDATFRVKDVAAIKNYMTVQQDKMRPPYGTSVKTYPRHSVFCATCNEEKFLHDSTGSRRFLVVKARKPILREAVLEARNKFWQCALSLYLAGERWWFEKHESDALSVDNEQYSEENPYTERIALALDRAYSKCGGKPTALSGTQIAKHLLGLPIDSLKGKRNKMIVQAMNNLGYELKRVWVGQSQIRFYVKSEWGNNYTLFTEDDDCQMYTAIVHGWTVSQ